MDLLPYLPSTSNGFFTPSHTTTSSNNLHSPFTMSTGINRVTSSITRKTGTLPISCDLIFLSVSPTLSRKLGLTE